jgi:hypothetical protein
MRSYVQAVIEQLCADPDDAVEYLSAILEDRLIAAA